MKYPGGSGHFDHYIHAAFREGKVAMPGYINETFNRSDGLLMTQAIKNVTEEIEQLRARLAEAERLLRDWAAEGEWDDDRCLVLEGRRDEFLRAADSADPRESA
jgi:hypothetical protein